MSYLRRICYKNWINFPSIIAETIEYGETEQMQFDATRKHSIRVISAQIPATIPNIYNDGEVNTGLCGISNDGGATWTPVQLDEGTYTVSSINNAINAAIPLGWYTNVADPAFTMQLNPSVNKCYIMIDSTKMVGGAQFAIDFGMNNSDMASLLGFTAVSSFIVDGTYTASNYPYLSYQGLSADIFINGFGPFCMLNGRPSEYLCSININPEQSVSYYSFPGPDNVIPFETQCIVGPTVNKWTLTIEGSQFHRPLRITRGLVSLDFIILEH